MVAVPPELIVCKETMIVGAWGASVCGAKVFQGECNKASALDIYRTGGFAGGMWLENIAGNIRAWGVEGGCIAMYV